MIESYPYQISNDWPSHYLFDVSSIERRLDTRDAGCAGYDGKKGAEKHSHDTSRASLNSISFFLLPYMDIDTCFANSIRYK